MGNASGSSSNRTAPRDGDGSAFAAGQVTRRQVLQGGAVALGALVLDAEQAVGDVAAEPASVGRSELSFDEGWRFHRGDVGGAQSPSFDDRGWRVLDVPHDWSIEDLPYAPASADGGATAAPSAVGYMADGSLGAGTSVPPSSQTGSSPPPVIGPFDSTRGVAGTAYMIGGVGWYRKTFTLADLGLGSTGGQRYELRFDGVYQNADFYLNGVHLGFHPCGYTPVAFDLTPHLRTSGTNVLAVRVDNSGATSRWYSGSGIFRHTWLTVTGPVRIPLFGVYVTTPKVSRQRSVAHVEVSVANLGKSTSPVGVRVTVLDPKGRAVASRTASPSSVNGGSTAVSKLDLDISPAKLWSPEAPDLYTAVSEVVVDGNVVDRVTTTFGIRSLVWNAEVGFQLNGNTVELNGGNVHEDHGPMGAVGLYRSQERRVEILKAAGFNAIRTAHNPPAPDLLDVCDRLGMLVWDEFTDCWDKGKSAQDYSVHFLKHWRQDLGDMILRDRNHPSIIIWSLGNEISQALPDDYASVGAEMAKVVRALDTTRPVTLGGGAGFVFDAPDDASWEWTDVGDVHYGVAPYERNHAAHPDKAQTQSEDFPSLIYKNWQEVQVNPWVAGTFVWSAWDYLGEAGSYPWFSAFTGDIDLIGQRKPANCWRAAVQGQSPVEVLVERPKDAPSAQAPALWSYYDELASWTWDVDTGDPLTVHVYTPGNSVELLLNGIPVGVCVPVQCVATFKVPYEPGELTAVASNNGSEIGRKTLTTAGAPAALRLTSDVKSLTTGRDDLAHVLVEVIDAKGRRVPDAVTKVEFALRGAGELAGVANGNPHNVDSFKQPRRHTWHGQALAILRPAKKPGTVTLTATAHGLKAATLTLPVARPESQRTPKTMSLASFGGGRPAVLALATLGMSSALRSFWQEIERARSSHE